MGSDLRIYEIHHDIDAIGLKKITTIYNYDTIEKLLKMGRNNWFLDGESGAIFELKGNELNSIKDLLEFEDNNLAKYEFKPNKWYECRFSY